MSRLNLGNSLILDSDYSTEEVKTGATWTDGKPIYRKTWYKLQNSVITLPEYLETTSFTDTVDTVVTVNAVRIWNYSTPNHTNPIPYYSGSSDYMQWALDNSGFGLFGGSGSALYGYTVTMFYTKTTD